MKHYIITRPIGLRTPCDEVESICGNADIYKRCGIRPNHFIIPLDQGSGRTTLVEYMTDMYKEAGVLNYTSGLDDYIEISLDGTLQQLRQAFAEIDSAAIYTNEFCNVVGMDISGIASHLGETQFIEFLKNTKRVCDHACVIFFVHSTPNRNEEKLLEKLCETVDNIKRLEVEPYTKDDMCKLIIKIVSEHGIEIKQETVFSTVLLDMVSKFSISSVKDAVVVADEIIFYADFSGRTPVIDESNLKSMLASWQNNTERSILKK